MNTKCRTSQFSFSSAYISFHALVHHQFAPLRFAMLSFDKWLRWCFYCPDLSDSTVCLHGCWHCYIADIYIYIYMYMHPYICMDVAYFVHYHRHRLRPARNSIFGVVKYLFFFIFPERFYCCHVALAVMAARKNVSFMLNSFLCLRNLLPRQSNKRILSICNHSIARRSIHSFIHSFVSSSSGWFLFSSHFFVVRWLPPFPQAHPQPNSFFLTHPMGGGQEFIGLQIILALFGS